LELGKQQEEEGLTSPKPGRGRRPSSSLSAGEGAALADVPLSLKLGVTDFLGR